ncbi:MAG: hypothetical protein KF915_20540 [Polyangiaceae bacterium]|nr:hypothetical protein [Polyangiaceae bacterium]
MPKSAERGRAIELVLGVLFLAAVALHDWRAIQEDRFADCFWLCNVSAVGLALGWLLASPRLVSAAGIWMLPGCLVWLADVWLASSSIIPTSYAVHLGGAALALAGARRFGVPRCAWLGALALLAAVVLFSRGCLPEAANVNAAHAVPSGWGVLGATRGRFIVATLVLATGSAWLFSWVLTRVATARRTP